MACILKKKEFLLLAEFFEYTTLGSIHKIEFKNEIIDQSMKIIKKILDVFGLEVHRKMKNQNSVVGFDTFFSPIRNNVLSCYCHLKEKKFYPDVVIDVGVADGTPELTGAFGNAYFVWVEPLIEFEAVLKKLSMDYRGEYHLCAAGKESGEIFLNVHEDLAGSSLFQEIDGEIADGVSRKVAMKDLDTLVDDEFKRNILLKIDVQGAELDVLDGAKRILNYTEVVILEVSMFKFQHNSPDFYDVIIYMKQKGFVVYDLFHGHNRPLDDALAQVDIVFVKENGQFRSSHNWATEEQRKLINNRKANIRTYN